MKKATVLRSHKRLFYFRIVADTKNIVNLCKAKNIKVTTPKTLSGVKGDALASKRPLK